MHNVIDNFYADKDACDEFLNGYHHDIMTMLKQGFREMATDHMENGRVRQDGVISGVAPGRHDQAALGVI